MKKYLKKIGYVILSVLITLSIIFSAYGRDIVRPPVTRVRVRRELEIQ